MQPVMAVVDEEDSPNKRPPHFRQYNEEGVDEGSLASSKITHVTNFNLILVDNNQ